MNWLAAIFIGISCAAVLYALLAVECAGHWQRENLPRQVADADLPPLTLLRPIKSGVPALREKLTQLALAMRAGDRLVLGVSDASPEAATADALCAEFVERDIVVVRCRESAALNPKISKLMQMDAAAGGEYLLLTDSEAQIDAAWLAAFRREWAASGADAMTCGYRFTGAASWLQSLDAAPVLLSLWPGLFLVRRFGRINFTLGACAALRRGHLANVGGWAAFGGELAEDNRLGAALDSAGHTIRLSRQVAPLESDSMTWRDYWRHQRRVAVTYRIGNPAGFAGMVFTYSVWANGWMVTLPMREMQWRIGLFLLCLITQVIRWLLFREVAKAIGFPRARLFSTMLVSDFVATVCWLLAWISPRVWWAGKWWRISPDGKLRET